MVWHKSEIDFDFTEIKSPEGANLGAKSTERKMDDDGDKSSPIIAFPCSLSTTKDNLNGDIDMANDFRGFLKLSRTLLDDVRFKDAPIAYQMVLINLMKHAAYKAQEFNDHGKIIVLQPGQVCISKIPFAQECGKHFSKNDVARAIAYFEKLKIVSHEVSHRKMIVTFTRQDVCDSFKNTSEPMSEPKVSQERAKSEPQTKKYKKEKKEKNNTKKANAFSERVIELSRWHFEKLRSVKPDAKKPASLESTIRLMIENDNRSVESYKAIVEHAASHWQDRYVSQKPLVNLKNFRENFDEYEMKLTKPQQQAANCPRALAQKWHGNCNAFCEIKVTAEGACFIPLAGANTEPFTLKFKESDFADRFEQQLRKRRFL